MKNHRKNIFKPHKFTNPKCTLYQNDDKDTWPHLLSLCNHKFFKALKIARHNIATHQLINLLKSCIHTKHYTLTNIGNKGDLPHDSTTPPWILQCSYQTTKSTS